MTKIEENIVNIAMRAGLLLHTGQIKYAEAEGHMGMTQAIVALAQKFEDLNADVDFNSSEKEYWEEIDRFAEDQLLWLYGADPDAPEASEPDPKQIVQFNETSKEELNVQLYYKMSEELDAFRMELACKDTEEVLRDCYALALREDLVLAMENNDLESCQAAAMLGLDQPLAAAVQAFERMESSCHMEEMWQAIENAAFTLTGDPDESDSTEAEVLTAEEKLEELREELVNIINEREDEDLDYRRATWLDQRYLEVDSQIQTLEKELREHDLPWSVLEEPKQADEAGKVQCCGDAVLPMLHEDLAPLSVMCRECDSQFCAFNPEGVCRYPLVYGKEPGVHDNGCNGFCYQERLSAGSGETLPDLVIEEERTFDTAVKAGAIKETREVRESDT